MPSGNYLVDYMERDLDIPEPQEVFCDVCGKYEDECICKEEEDESDEE